MVIARAMPCHSRAQPLHHRSTVEVHERQERHGVVAPDSVFNHSAEALLVQSMGGMIGLCLQIVLSGQATDIGNASAAYP